MTKPQIHGRRSSFSANNALEKLGKSLADIREQDSLTWTDIGRTLGKSRDRAAAYADGDGDMGVVSFLLGCREWNGRFAGDALALIGMKLVPVEPSQHTDRASLSCLTKLLLEMSLALETDDEIDDQELAQMGTVLENAGQAIDRLRERRRFRGEAA